MMDEVVDLDVRRMPLNLAVVETARLDLVERLNSSRSALALAPWRRVRSAR